MRILLLLFCLILANTTFAQNKKVCFSVDDMPVVNYGIKDSTYQKVLFGNLVSALIRNDIPAIGFVNAKKLFRNDTLIQYQYDLLRSWISAGLELGNHTYSHPDYNKISFEEYAKNILKGEPIIKQVLKEQGKEIKYFRHPFLHVGETKEKADSLSEFLAEHDYTVAPVTVDNDDYLFALAYKRASVKEDSSLMKRIGHDYITYMEKKIKYFEMQANRLFDRNINQILLFHASLLNADYVDSLAAMYRKNNYTFVSMDEALQDEVYNTEVTVYKNWGISWLDRWALSGGKKGEFFKDDPATPQYIVELTK